MRRTVLAVLSALTVVTALAPASAAPTGSGPDAETQRLVAFWTPERVAAAIPRDVVVDSRGRSFMRDAAGQLRPFGSGKAITPLGGKVGGGTKLTTTDVSNSQWTKESQVLRASGRILFVMGGSYYVCSGTVINDGSTSDGRSQILTAAHCVYDDAAKAFATSALFIPNQQGTTARATNSVCSDDPIGCWAVNFGVVDTAWASRTWPDNIPWDYGYYVVNNTGRHTAGINAADDALEVAVGTAMSVSFAAPTQSRSSAFGYSYKNDPKLMYCAQARTTTNNSDNWWLSNCRLSGGASGGPWLDEATTTGNGVITSVNSWGYSNLPGMAGPKLDGSSGTSRSLLPVCIYRLAKNAAATSGNIIGSTCPAS